MMLDMAYQECLPLLDGIAADPYDLIIWVADERPSNVAMTAAPGVPH